MAQPTDPRALLAALPDVVFVIDADLRLSYVNDRAASVMGWEPARWLGRNVLDLVHPDDLAVVVSSADVLQGKALGTPIEVRAKTASGSWRWLEIIGADASHVDGVGGMVCIARDLTQRRMWEVAAGETARFQQVVQHAASITLLLDAHGVISSANGAFTRLLGHDPTVVVGQSLVHFAAPASAMALADAIARCISTGAQVNCESLMRLEGPQQDVRPIRFEFVNLLDDPVVNGLIVTAHDVTDLQSVRTKLEHLASHDVLTGLVNRSVLTERLEQVVAHGESAAVVFIDLDRFKPVNDLLGHESGDELLRHVAERLLRQVRPRDLVARVGGDEFVVLAARVHDEAGAATLCERIELALGTPYALEAGPVRITASVGFTLATPGSTVTGLLADADLAMYRAKAASRGEPLRGVDGVQLSSVQRRQLVDDLAAGIPRGEVIAYLQPVVDVRSGALVAVEALARWMHPRLGLLEPSLFLDLATDAGLDLQLGDAVLEAACSAIEPLPAHVLLSVNLSVTQLADRDLSSRLTTILRRHGVPHSRLTVEITEQATLGRRATPGQASPERTLLDLHAAGVALALDDFGTGFSSLTHIRDYPLSAIKIDRSFVAGVLDQPEDRAVVAAVVGLAGMLGLHVVGEGVETVAQLDALRELGCHFIQGYLISPPMSPVGLLNWLHVSAAARLGDASD